MSALYPKTGMAIALAFVSSTCVAKQVRVDAPVPIDVVEAELLAMPERGEQDDSLLTLIHLMQTDIATKTTAVDADLAPGFVTVLRGEDLLAKGKITVADALSLAPSYDENFQPIVRGVGGIVTGAAGKVKFLLNGIPVNDNLISSPRVVFNIPVEQVERIEFIRGPGSAVHGEFALLGVINVITRTGDAGAYTRVGGFDGVSAGAHVGGELFSDIRVDLNVAGWRSNGDDLRSGTDALFEGQLGMFGQGLISRAPGRPNNAAESLSSFMRVGNDNTQLLVQHVYSGVGDGYGIGNFLPPDREEIVTTDHFTMIEGRHQKAFSTRLKARVHGGWQHFRTNFIESESAPPGFFGVYPDGIRFDSQYGETRLYGGLDLTWTGWNGHTVLGGISYADIESNNVIVRSNVDQVNVVPGIGLGLPLPNLQELSPGYEDRQRRLFSAYLQDEWAVTDQLDLTWGLHYDHYSDIGNSLTPRVAAVYRPGPGHALKAQYGEAFRPPNFSELHNTTSINTGNPDNEPETVNTIELGYVYKQPGTVLRATAFYLQLNDLLMLEGGIIQNSGDADVHGVELEWEHEISRQWKLDGNLTWADTENERGDPLQGSTHWMGNLGFIYQPRRTQAYALQYRYLGERERDAGDPRTPLTDEHTVDLTATLTDLIAPGISVRAVVNNLFDEDIHDPAPAFTYADDFPRDGRAFWLQISANIAKLSP